MSDGTARGQASNQDVLDAIEALREDAGTIRDGLVTQDAYDARQRQINFMMLTMLLMGILVAVIAVMAVVAGMKANKAVKEVRAVAITVDRDAKQRAVTNCNNGNELRVDIRRLLVLAQHSDSDQQGRFYEDALALFQSKDCAALAAGG